MASHVCPAVTEMPAVGSMATVRVEQRLAAGSFASFLAMLFGIGITIVQVPILLQAWGEETYGAWLLVTATYSLVISLDLGHQNFVGNRIAMIGLQDAPTCRQVLGSAVRAACVIGLIEVAAAAAIAWSGLFSVWLAMSQAGEANISSQAEISLLLHTVYFALIGSVGGIVVRLYSAGGLFARAQWAGIAQRSAMFLGLAGATMGGASMLWATMAYLGSGALVSGWVFYDVYRRFPEFWPWWRNGSIAMGMHQAVLSLGLTATAVSDQCAAAGLLGIAGSRIHGSGVATLGTLRTLTNSVLQAAGIVVLPVAPDLSRYAAAMDHDKATAAIATLWLMSTSALAAMVTAFVPFAQPVYEWWTRGKLLFPAPLFLLLALGVLIRQWQSPMALFLFSANRVRSQVIVSAVRTSTLLGCLAFGFSMSGDIAVAGFAVLCSEAVAAFVIMAFAASFLRDMGGSLPFLAATLAFSQVAVSFVAGWLLFSNPGSSVAIVAACLVSHVAIAVVQWRTLPFEVRNRIYAVSSRS